jgi:hypothetical protein
MFIGAQTGALRFTKGEPKYYKSSADIIHDDLPQWRTEDDPDYMADDYMADKKMGPVNKE